MVPDPNTPEPTGTSDDSGANSDSGGRREQRESPVFDGESPSLNELYRILSSDCRRDILRHLRDRTDPISVLDLSERLASAEGSSAEASTEAANQLRVAFEHVHFPVLEDARLVEYDQTRQLVEPGDGFYLVTPYLDMPR